MYVKSHMPLTLHNSAFLQSKEKLCLEKVVSNSVVSDGSLSKKSCSVVPVWLSHASIPNCRKLVYALLDSQSDLSFILEKTLDSFNVSSLDVDLSISTMSGVNEQVSWRKFSGFKVQGSNTSQIIDLPPVFSRLDIPFDCSHIPKPHSFVDHSLLQRGGGTSPILREDKRKKVLLG